MLVGVSSSRSRGYRGSLPPSWLGVKRGTWYSYPSFYSLVDTLKSIVLISFCDMSIINIYYPIETFFFMIVLLIASFTYLTVILLW